MASEDQAGREHAEQTPDTGDGAALPPPTTGAPQPSVPQAPTVQAPTPQQPGAYYYPPYYGYAYQPQPPRRKSAWGPVLIVVAVVAAVALVGFLVVGMMAAAMGRGGGGGWALGGEKIGLIHVSGMITSGGNEASLFSFTTGADSIAAELRRAADNDEIKAVILRVNSPGGSAAAAQEIYNSVMRYREQTGRPVIASMSDVGASGAYYVSAAADKIVADPGTLTGSIGVIMQGWEIEDLMKKYGVTANTIRSGQYKDTMSMFRHMRPDERQYLQEMIDDVLDQFVSDVAAGRGMSKEEVKKLADGRIMTGRQAHKSKLVDELGGLHEAIEAAKQAAGITGEARLVPLRQRSPLEELLGPLPYGGQTPLAPYMALRQMSPATHLLEHPWLGPGLQAGAPQP